MLKPSVTLRSRLVALVIAAVVPVFGLSVLQSVLTTNAAISQATKNLESAASLVAASQERIVDSTRQVLMMIAYAPGLLDGNAAECQHYFKTLNDRLEIYTNLGLIGTDGVVRCHGMDNGVGGFAGDRSYFKSAVATRDFAASGYLAGKVSGAPLIAFALPSLSSKGSVTAVAFVALNLKELSRLMAMASLPRGSRMMITDRQGIVLVTNPEQPELVGKPAPSPTLLAGVRTARKAVLEGTDSTGSERIYAFSPVGNSAASPFLVSVSAARDDIVAPARMLLLQEFGALTLVAFLGCWVAWMLGGWAIVRPAAEILEATGELQAGQLEVRIPISPQEPNTEFTRIAESFNLMADSLEQRERELANELAHSRQAYATLALTMNSMQEGLIAVDTEGILLLVNDTAASLFATETSPRVLSPLWPKLQGLFYPGTDRFYEPEELPLYRALNGESGGPLRIMLKNSRVPEGRLLRCSYRAMAASDGIVGAMMLISDITEVDRMQVERDKSYLELRDTQRRLLEAQRIGRLGNWELDMVSGKFWWSEGVHELFGFAPGVFDGRHETLVQMIHPEDRDRYSQAMDSALYSRADLDVEYRIVTQAGDTRWIHKLGKVQVNDQRQVVSRTGVLQDITTRKASQLALKHSTDLLLRTGEMARVGGWEVEVDTLKAYWSDEIFRIHEVDPADGLDAMHALDFYAPEAQRDFRRVVRDAVEHGTPWDVELPMITAKGRHIWVRAQGRALIEGGHVVSLVGALQDITQRHEADEHLRLLESSIARLNDMVLITEAEPLSEPGPRIVYVNDAFVRHTGYSREDAIGKSPRFLQGPKTQRAELDRIDAALRQREPVKAELINYTKQGNEFWVELDIVPLSDAKGVFTHVVAIERDITLRKQAEQALVDSEQRYIALFESAPLPMWVFDVETLEFLAVNDRSSEVYGYSREEFLSMSIMDIRNDAEKAVLRDLVSKGFVDQATPLKHMRKDGTEFTVQVMSAAVPYLGRQARFAAVYDVTARVKAEKDVQDYLFTLQRSADATQAITWHQTLDGTMQEVAEQARGVIGAHQAVVSLNAGDDWAQSIGAVSLSEKYARFRDQTQPPDGTGIYAMVCQNNRAVRMTQAELEAHPRWRGFGTYADQHPAMRGWLAVPLTGRSGKNMGLLQLSDKYEGEFTQQDEYVAIELAQLASIAIENAQLIEEVGRLNEGLEDKVAERTAALARHEALFRALADQAPQVVWTASPGGRVTYLNRAWFDLAGGELKDWRGTGWFAAIHPEDLPDVVAQWKISVENQVPYVGMRRLRARDGSYHAMSYRASPVFDNDGKLAFWVGIDADVTEMKAIEAALRLSNQELEAFSYSVSHDLRSPLNTIDGFSRLLGKQLAGQSTEKVQHYLARMQAGVAQMGRLIEDLLSLAQVTRVQLRQEAIDITQMANEIVAEWRVRQPDRQVLVKVAPGLAARGDARLMRVVLENLLGNAWKFTSQVAHAEITVGKHLPATGDPAFFVQDNGAGFDMAYADKLFTAFQRLHAVSEFPGTGIGLATVSRIISRHGGKVWAHSEPGKGATFCFTIPLVAPSA